MESVLKFEFLGTQALLMHCDDIEKGDELAKLRERMNAQKTGKAGDDRSPPYTWQTYLYSDEDRTVAMPSAVIMGALKVAGGRLKLKGNTSYKSLTQSGLLISTEFCPFWYGTKETTVTDEEVENDLAFRAKRLVGDQSKVVFSGRQVTMFQVERFKDEPFSVHCKEVEKLGFKLDLKRPPVGASRHIRVRPRFQKWAVTGEITITDSVITPVTLATLFDIAGRRAGLCDWRPSSKKSPGPHGVFKATVWNEAGNVVYPADSVQLVEEEEAPKPKRGRKKSDPNVDENEHGILVSPDVYDEEVEDGDQDGDLDGE